MRCLVWSTETWLLGLSSVEVAQLPDLARGEGLWRVNERAFVVSHLVAEGELSCFATDSRMIIKPRQFRPEESEPESGSPTLSIETHRRISGPPVS